MYCKHCGSSIDDNAKFCQHCGGEQYVEDNAPTVDEPVEEVDPFAEKKAEIADYVFRYGLLGAIFSQTLILSFLGIIFSSKAKNAANKFKRSFGGLRGKILAGHILSIVGLVLGIIYTVFIALYLSIFFMALLCIVLSNVH